MNNQKGMTLIEVMVAAGLMGVLAYMGMMLFEQQNRQARDIQSRFEMQDVLSQIRVILGDPVSCVESFREIKFTDKKEPKIEGPPFLTEVVDVKEDEQKNDVTLVTKSRFLTKQADAKKKYGNNLIQIDRYEFSTNDDPEVGFNEDTRRGNIYLNIYFDRDEKSIGNAIMRKSVIINYVLDMKKDTLISCSAAGLSTFKGKGGGKLVIQDMVEDISLNGLSGSQACAKIGKTCQYVVSHNYVLESHGDTAIGQVCQSSYNQALTGVSDQSPHGPWHQCEAKLGFYNTFVVESQDHTSGVVCQGLFAAVCM